MNYIQQFIDKFGHTSVAPTGKTGETPIGEYEATLVVTPAKPAEPHFAGFAGPSLEELADFTADLALWPIEPTWAPSEQSDPGLDHETTGPAGWGPRDVRRGSRWLPWHEDRFGPATEEASAPAGGGRFGRPTSRVRVEDEQVGEFDPEDLDEEGKFDIDRFFVRLAEKHGLREWRSRGSGPELDRTAVAARGDSLRARGLAVPLCWLPRDTAEKRTS